MGRVMVELQMSTAVVDTKARGAKRMMKLSVMSNVEEAFDERRGN